MSRTPVDLQSSARPTHARRVCVVSGGRADYGNLSWLLKALAADARFTLQVAVTGTHLSPEHGLTYRVLEADGFVIDRKIEVLLSSDTALGMSKAVGLGVIGFADAFADLNPDIVVLMGDRFEILAAAQAAFLGGLAVGHISGGEITEGAIDDVLRHCITKLARYHFVASEPYRSRVIQLGELPEHVFNVGDPGLDNIVRLALLDRRTLSAELELDLQRPFFLATYHPVTLGGQDPSAALQALFDAFDARSNCNVVFTRPNADPGGRKLDAMLDAYAARRVGQVAVFVSLGQQRYLSAMKHCVAVVGNSSSGIIEAPAMGKTSVNIGTRQQGRLKAASILDADEETASIVAALSYALTDACAERASRTASLYGNCDASSRILELLATVDVRPSVAKRFFDISAPSGA